MPITAKDYATVRVYHSTKARVHALKVHPRETADDVINRLCELAERELREQRKAPGQVRRAS